MRTFLALGVAVLVGLTGNAVAQAPAPGIVAEASLQPQGGALVVWNLLPGMEVDGYEISRSHAGAPFSFIGTADATTSTFLDPDGQSSDIYVVTATVSGGTSITSNPAPALPAVTIFCPLVEFIAPFPFVRVNLACIWPIDSFQASSSAPRFAPESPIGGFSFANPALLG